MNQIPFRLCFVSGEENIKDDVKKMKKKIKLIMKMFSKLFLVVVKNEKI